LENLKEREPLGDQSVDGRIRRPVESGEGRQGIVYPPSAILRCTECESMAGSCEHGDEHWYVTYQRPAFFIVTAMRNPNIIW
jgi:hypothetical protein